MNEPITAFTLENGMRFIVAPDGAAPVAAVGFCARVGVAEEPADRRGIAHFLEHMMFRGSERFGPREHTARIGAMGGQCNAGTGLDMTYYWNHVPASGLAEVFALEADRFQRLAVTPEATDTERRVVLEELRMYENQPMTRALRRILREVGGEHPYALDPLGRQEDLAATAPADLAAFWRRWYRPDTVFGVVAGAVEPGRVRALAEEHFGSWTADEAPPHAVPPLEVAQGYKAVRLPVQVPLAVRVHRLQPSAEEDLPAIELIKALLAGGRSSPLQQRLVHRSRLCVFATCRDFALVRGGVLALVGGFLPPGGHAARRQAIAEVCDRLAQDGPDEGELARQLKRFRRDRAGDGYSARARMEGLIQAEVREGDYRRYADALADLEAITPDRVRQVARRLFAPENTLELDVQPEHTPWWSWPAGLAMRVWRR